MAEPVETSPLLSTIQINNEDKKLQQIENMRNAVALNIVDRCINYETSESFTKQQIIDGIINNEIPIDRNKAIYDSATEIINMLESNSDITIMYKEQYLLCLFSDSDYDASATPTDTETKGDTISSSSRKNKQKQIEKTRMRIAYHISLHCINTDTNERFSYGYILNEINDLEFNIRLDRSVETQASYIVSQLMTLDEFPIVEVFEYDYPTVSASTWSHMGRNTFIYGAMIGSDFTFLICTILVVLTTFTIWVLKIAATIPIIIIGLILMCAVIVFLCRTSLVDPGFIPRGKLPIPPADVMTRSDGSKFCDTCLIWRPPRSKHCRYCDSCVQRFDHHCPWLGTCVAQRNYRDFMIFIALTSVYTLYVFVTGIIMLIPSIQTVGDSARGLLVDYWLCSLITITSGFVFLSVGSLSIYHSYLICINQTTNENVSSNYARMKNRNDEGIKTNCYNMCCLPIKPSYISY